MAVTRLTTNGLTGTKYDIASADNYYMEPIATNLLSSAAASVTFSNIPQGYKHLQIRALVRGTFADTNTYPNIHFNGDTGSNYAWHILDGNGSSASAGAGSTQTSAGVPTFTAGNSTASIFGVLVMDILDYANTSKFKTVRYLGGHDQNGSGIVRFSSGLWQNTAPITSIAFTALSSSNWATNSRFSLYGIKG